MFTLSVCREQKSMFPYKVMGAGCILVTQAEVFHVVKLICGRKKKAAVFVCGVRRLHDFHCLG